MSLAHPDSTANPMTLTPRDEYSFCSLLSSGISLTQFSHQVAQKSSTTILSLSSSELSVRPSSCGSENCGTESGDLRVESVGDCEFPVTTRENRAISMNAADIFTSIFLLREVLINRLTGARN